MNKKENLVWIDLEMTGLNPVTDVIVEIATIITDTNLNILYKGPELVIYQPDEHLDRMGEWVTNQHTKSGLKAEIQHSTISVREAEQKTLAVIQEYCLPRSAPLCGNSVWQDGIFLTKYMPSIMNYLHYRIVDVSSFKEILSRWYPNNPNLSFKKKDMHRAMIDIEESIEELKHYRKHFFIT